MEKLQEIQNTLTAKFEALSKGQPPHIEAGVAAAGGALQGAFFGGLFGFMMKNQPPPPPGVVAPPQPVAMVGGPLFLGRNVAIMTGMNAGLAILIKRLRGDVEDWKNGAAALFSAGACYSLVANVFPPKVLPMGTVVPVGASAILGDAVKTGLVFAVFQSIFYALGNKFGNNATKEEDVSFRATGEMLTALGLEKFEKNFKKGQLNDSCLTLLTEGVLQEVKIPPGPRLQILNHVDAIKAYRAKYGNKQMPAACLSLALPVRGQPAW